MLKPVGQGNYSTDSPRTPHCGRWRWLQGSGATTNRNRKSPVTNRIPEYLKLHIEPDETKPAPPQLQPEIERLLSLLPAATGMQAEVSQQPRSSQLTFSWSDSQVEFYRVSLKPTANRAHRAELSAVHDLEESLTTVLNTLNETRHELRRRNAELATYVPVVSVEEDGLHLAERLEAVLQSSAEMLGCYGAGLYLLDEATTALKLRAHFGLDADAFTQQDRTLDESAADVEAMAGHAVVIEDTRRQVHWQVPEPAVSAICVPIASATTILGTLWYFRDRQSDFTPTEQNVAEICAGRLAADLERNVLVQEVRQQRQTVREDVWTDPSEARLAPFVPGWEVFGSSALQDPPGCFCHWHLQDTTRLHLALGAAQHAGQPLATANFRAAHAAHTQHDPRVAQLFSHINQTLWNSSSTADPVSLFHASLDPTSGALEYALSGDVYGYVLRPHGWEPLPRCGTRLGTDCDFAIEAHRQAIMPGDVLLILANPCEHRNQEQAMNQTAERLLRHTHLSAAELTEMAQQTLQERSPASADRQTVLVAKRAER